MDDALGVFVGYLMLDALISNQDRHHENWSLVLTAERDVYLSPTYDHASSLGRNERDSVRQERLTTKDEGRSVQRYIERAKSAFYESSSDPKPLSTLQAFWESAKLRTHAAQAWLDRLCAVTLDQYVDIFSQIPGERITPTAIEFAMKMIELNRQRLLKLKGEL